MGINKANHHKRRASGAAQSKNRKSRKFELGRQPANTRLGERKLRYIRVRGGNIKNRALRLDSGNFSWGTESCTRKTRILDVVYNASSNELVRTKTLVKNAIILIDATPFRQWYEQRYGLNLGSKDKSLAAKSPHKIDPALAEQFPSGRVLACISSRPGQDGIADGYILEGPELQFYAKKAQKKRSK